MNSLLSFLLSLSCSFAGKPVIVPLQREPDTLESLRFAHEWDMMRHGDGGSGEKMYNRTIFFASIYLRLYYTNIQFGSNFQTFYVAADTGSADLWVASANCTDGPDSYCTEGRNLYNSSASKTYSPMGDYFEITYGSGQVTGYLSKEMVTFAGLRTKGQVFAEIQTGEDSMLGLPYDSIMGMAFPPIASIKNQPTFMQNLFSQNNLTRQFAFYLRNTDDPPFGNIQLGGYDPAYYTGTLTWFPLVGDAWWAVAMKSAGYSKRQVNYADHIAIMDTGSTFLTMPYEIFQNYQRYLGVSGPDYEIPCARLPYLADIILYIGPNAQPFSLTPKQYVIKDSDNKCWLAIRGFDEPGFNLWIFGATFLRAYFSVYDFEKVRVGLAPAVQTS